MKRWDIINNLIENNGYTRYLEIGVRNKGNFPKIKAKVKHGIDPVGNPTYKMTSDEFFRTQGKGKFYDIILVDGLHHYKQALRDIYNSLEHLNEDGTIVVHDCNPQTKKAQQVPRVQKLWNGDVWKAFVFLRCTNPLLKMHVIDTDHGCGIIQKGKQSIYLDAELNKCLTWKYFNKHRIELLNLVSANEQS